MWSELDGRWLAVQVRSRFERTVGESLSLRGYEIFVPTYPARRGPAPDDSSLPLLPGYVLCRFNCHINHHIIAIPGVLKLVGTKSGPSVVDESEVQALHMLTTGNVSAKPCTYLTQGEHVVFSCGPLAGIRGIVSAIKGRKSAIVSLELLRRSVSVECDPTWLAPGTTEPGCGSTWD
jgi:transcription antitermination factor NusG